MEGWVTVFFSFFLGGFTATSFAGVSGPNKLKISKHSQNCQILSGSLSKSCENAKHKSAKDHSKLLKTHFKSPIFLLNMKSHEFYINWSNREYVPHGSINLILALHTFYAKIGLISVVQTESKISLNMVII